MNVLWTIIELAVNLLDSFLILQLLSSVLGYKYNSVWHWILYIIGLTAICSLANRFCSSMFQMLAVLSLVLLIFTVTLTNGNIFLKVLWVAITQLIFFGLDMLHCSIVLQILNDVPAEIIYSPGPIRLFNMTVTRALITVIVFWLKRRSLLFRQHEEIKSVALLLCPMISWMALLLVTRLFATDRVSGTYVVISTFLICLINVIYLFQFITMKKQDELIKEDALIIQRLNLEKEQYSILESWRHDFKNHLSVISSYAESNDNKGLIDYIDSIRSDVLHGLAPVNTGNSLFDSIIGIFAQKALNNGIHVKLEIVLPPLTFVEGHDLCSLIGNLWDNAIEGCKSSGSNDCSISFKTSVHNNFFIISVSNTSKDLRGSELITTKTEPNHGVGLKTIHRILRQYHGIYEIFPEYDKFTTKIALPLSDTDNPQVTSGNFFYWESN